MSEVGLLAPVRAELDPCIVGRWVGGGERLQIRTDFDDNDDETGDDNDADDDGSVDNDDDGAVDNNVDEAVDNNDGDDVNLCLSSPLH